MENYRIINDLDKLQQFIDWLPELEAHETYYVSLLARNKYCKDIVHIRTDVEQLRRFTTTKERMIHKIKQLECELGTYTQKETPIPQEALALYIHPNPRSQTKAMERMLRRGMDLILQPYSNYNVHQEALSAIQQSKSKNFVIDFDFDNLSIDDFNHKVLNVKINSEAVSIVKTRGGFHALVKPEKVTKQFEKAWYISLYSLIPEKDKAVGDLLMPVPGCTQGNFIPHLITLDGVVQ